jgi:hypothetical protein
MEITNNSYVATLKLGSKISSCCSWLSFDQVAQSLNIYRLRSPRMFKVFKVVVAKVKPSEPSFACGCRERFFAYNAADVAVSFGCGVEQ